MARILTRCPRVLSPCPQPPTFASGAKSQHCTLCQKTVYNLSAMSAAERAALAQAAGTPCVRYALWVPVALVLATSAPASENEADGAELNPADAELTLVVGGTAPMEWRDVFLETEAEAEVDEAWLDTDPPR